VQLHLFEQDAAMDVNRRNTREGFVTLFKVYQRKMSKQIGNCFTTEHVKPFFLTSVIS